MGKAIEMGKTSATGSVQLFVGKTFSTVILALGTIIVGIFISPEDYGIFTTALVPSATFVLFLDWGIGYALTRYCANYRAAEKEGELRNIIISGVTFVVASGLILTLASLFTANFVATTIYNRPETAFLVALASITIFSTGLLICAQNVFVGFERMKFTTITLIVSGVTNGLLSPLLVYFGFGAFGAMVGRTVGSAAAGAIAVSMLYFGIFRKLPLGNSIRGSVFKTLRPMFQYGVPLSLSYMIAGLVTQIDNFLMSAYVDLSLIGNYRIASNFLVILTFFSYPIQTVLFPAFSKIDATKDKKLAKTVFSTSVKYSSLFITPVTIALMVLSAPIMSSIYANKYPFAPLYLTLYIAGYLTVLLGNLIYHNFLQAAGETRFLLMLNVFQFCLGVPLAFLLIPPFGILGMISLVLFQGTLTMLVGLYWTWKHYSVQADLYNSARVLLASIIAGITTYLFLTVFVMNAWIMLSLGIMIFFATYLVSAPLVGAIGQTDINSLRVMFSGLGPMSKVFGFVLVLIEKPLKIKESLSKVGRLQ